MKPLHLFLTLLSASLWGAAPLIHKTLLTRLHRHTIMTLTSFAYLTFLILSVPFFYNEIKSDVQKITAKDIGLIVFSALGVLYIGNLLYYYVLKYSDATIVSALESTAPLFTLILACFLFNDKITRTTLLGIFLIVSGVALVSFNDTKNVYEQFTQERF